MTTTVWHGVDSAKTSTEINQGKFDGSETITYQGTKAAVYDIAADLSSSGYDIKISQVAGPVHQVVGTYAYESEQWKISITHNKAMKNIMESDRPAIKKLTLYNKMALQRYVNNPEKYIDTPPVFSGSATDINNALTVYTLLTNNVKQVEVVYPVVKADYNCNYTFDLSGSLYQENDGKVISKSKLIAQTNMPANYSSILPESGDYVLVAGVVTGSGQIPCVYGYKQYPADTNITYNNSTQITQEYWYGLWATDLYDYVT